MFNIVDEGNMITVATPGMDTEDFYKLLKKTIPNLYSADIKIDEDGDFYYARERYEEPRLKEAAWIKYRRSRSMGGISVFGIIGHNLRQNDPIVYADLQSEFINFLLRIYDQIESITVTSKPIENIDRYDF